MRAQLNVIGYAIVIALLALTFAGTAHGVRSSLVGSTDGETSRGGTSYLSGNADDVDPQLFADLEPRRLELLKRSAHLRELSLKNNAPFFARQTAEAARKQKENKLAAEQERLEAERELQEAEAQLQIEQERALRARMVATTYEAIIKARAAITITTIESLMKIGDAQLRKLASGDLL